MDEAVIFLDHKNRIVDFNPAAQVFLSVPMEKALGMPGLDAIKSWTKMVKWFENVEEISTEVTLIQSGLDYDFDLSITPLLDERGDLKGRIILLRDITASKQAEEALKRANRNLMEEIRERKTAELTIFELATIDRTHQSF